jgi:hypothetical protein
MCLNWTTLVSNRLVVCLHWTDTRLTYCYDSVFSRAGMHDGISAHFPDRADASIGPPVLRSTLSRSKFKSCRSRSNMGWLRVCSRASVVVVRY